MFGPIRSDKLAKAPFHILLQHFVNTVARLLLPVDGAHAACCEEMATAMADAESAALKGLQQCIDTIMAEVELSLRWTFALFTEFV